MAQQLSFDVTGAPEAGGKLTAISDALLKLVMYLLPALLMAMIVVVPLILGGAKISDFPPLALAAGGAIVAGLVAIWAWRTFVAPHRAAMKVKAYGLSLPEIRAALAPFRSRAARFRGGWLLVNVLAAIGIPFLARSVPDAFALALLISVSFVLNGLRLWSDQSGVFRTLASYVLVILLWSCVMAILSFLMKNFDQADAVKHGIAGVILLLTFGFASSLTGRVWSLSRSTLADMRKRDPRGPVLFLRSFEDENWIEGVLKDALRPFGPFIGIGKPGELRPNGAARAYFAGDAWRPAVLNMMDEAAVMIVVLGHTPGLDWEIQQVCEPHRLGKTIFLFFGKDRDRKLTRLHTSLGNTREGEQLAALPISGDAWAAWIGRDRTWVTIKSTLDSVGEIQAGLDVALYGLLIDNADKGRAALE